MLTTDTLPSTSDRQSKKGRTRLARIETSAQVQHVFKAAMGQEESEQLSGYLLPLKKDRLCPKDIPMLLPQRSI